MSAYRDYLLGDGTVFRVPLSGSMDTGYALSTWTSTADAENPGFTNGDELKYGWAVLASSGIIYCIPLNAASIGMIDPATDTFSVVLGLKNQMTYQVTNKYNLHAVLAPNGFMYIFRSDTLRQFNTVTHETGPSNDISNPNRLTYDNGHTSSMITPGGKIYLPRFQANVGIYNTNTDTYSEFKPEDSGPMFVNDAQYAHGALHSNSKIYIAQYCGRN